MKTVFISASPVLTNEVNRYYNLLKDTLIKHLESKEAMQEANSTSDEIIELDEEGNEITQDEALKQQQKDLLKLA